MNNVTDRRYRKPPSSPRTDKPGVKLRLNQQDAPLANRLNEIKVLILYVNAIFFSVEEMTETARDGRQSQADNSGYFVCWGCGEFGQHCHGSKQEVTFQDGCVEKFCEQQAGRVKHVGCGSSHTVVVTSKHVTFLFLRCICLQVFPPFNQLKQL